MAKITQNQIVDASIYGIKQAENVITSSYGGKITTQESYDLIKNETSENDTITINDTIFQAAEVLTGAGRDVINVKKGVVDISDGADDDKINLGVKVSIVTIIANAVLAIFKFIFEFYFSPFLLFFYVASNQRKPQGE